MTNEDSSFYEEETWTKGLSREDTLEKLFRIAAYHYSKGEWDYFEYTIKILITFLPSIIRKQFKPLVHDTSEPGLEQHYEQFLNIHTKIEDDTNMIWKKRWITTYK